MKMYGCNVCMYVSNVYIHLNHLILDKNYWVPPCAPLSMQRQQNDRGQASPQHPGKVLGMLGTSHLNLMMHTQRPTAMSFGAVATAVLTGAFFSQKPYFPPAVVGFMVDFPINHVFGGSQGMISRHIDIHTHVPVWMCIYIYI